MDEELEKIINKYIAEYPESVDSLKKNKSLIYEQMSKAIDREEKIYRKANWFKFNKNNYIEAILKNCT